MDNNLFDEFMAKVMELEGRIDELQATVDEQAQNEFDVDQLRGFNTLFGLYDVTDNDVTVRAATSGKEACIAGVHYAVTGGGEELGVAITISANTYIYLNLTRGSPNTATLETSATMADGDDDEERVYLWYIPWTGTQINVRAIEDLRTMPHVPAMA